MKKQVKLKNTLYKFDDVVKNKIEDQLKEYGVNIDNCEIIRSPLLKSQTEETDDEERTVIKYISTRDVDEIGDIIIPNGVDYKQFVESGAPVMFGHNYSIPQIGKDEWIKADQYGIKVKQRYAKLHEGSLPDVLWNLTKQGMNQQSSVGIIPLQYVSEGDDEFKGLIKELKDKYPELQKTYKNCRRIIKKALLFEHSDVPLACNPKAGIISVSKAYMEAGADEKLLKQIGVNDSVDDDIEITLTNVEEDIEEKSVENIVKQPEIEKIEEKVVKKKKTVNLVKEPRTIKLIAKPTITIDKNAIKEDIKAEIRKKIGRIV